MKKLNLLWIIPLCLMVGMLAYSMLNNSVEKSFMPLVETCISYETNMDMAILLVQAHCLSDIITLNNVDFCDEFMNQSKILSKYNWKN